MKKAIILHGMPSENEYYNPKSEAQSNKHWLPWIQRQLILNGVLAQAIELPEPFNPVYEEWKKTFEQFNIDDETILVGHSCGGGFLLRWLSENNISVNKVALVAPWIDVEQKLETGFFNFEIDNNLLDRTESLDIFYSSDDEDNILSSKTALKEKLGAKYHDFSEMGHFTFGDMKKREFPELLKVLLETKNQD